MPIDDETTNINIANLLNLHDDDFVVKTYNYLLRRNPDEEGQEYYVGLLRQGKSRWQVISQIYRSEEMQENKTAIYELKEHMDRYKRSRLPFVGWIFRLLYSFDRESRIDVAIRRLENKMYVMEKIMGKLQTDMSEISYYSHQGDYAILDNNEEIKNVECGHMSSLDFIGIISKAIENSDKPIVYLSRSL